jgi:hypothetical protein
VGWWRRIRGLQPWVGVPVYAAVGPQNGLPGLAAVFRGLVAPYTGTATLGTRPLGEWRALASSIMFTRLKWFAAGSAATLGAGVYLGAKVKQARERMTPETIARAGVSTAAGIMGAAGRRMQRAGTTAEGSSSAEEAESVEPGSG